MSKIISEENPNTPQPSGGLADKVRKQARQLAYDVRYKVKQGFKEGQKTDPASLKQAYMSQLGKSPAPGPVKQLAKKMLIGESYDFVNVNETLTKSVSNAVSKVFVKTVEIEDLDGNPAYEITDLMVKEESSGERKYKIRVTDKKSGRSYTRMADRAKMSELRKNPNISSVEMTGYGTPYEGEKKKGSQTAAVKSGKGLSDKDYDGDGKVESPTAEYKGSRDKAIKKALHREEFIDEVNTEDDNPQANTKRIDVMKGKNKVKINPTQSEAVIAEKNKNNGKNENNGEEDDNNNNNNNLKKIINNIFRSPSQSNNPNVRSGKLNRQKNKFSFGNNNGEKGTSDVETKNSNNNPIKNSLPSNKGDAKNPVKGQGGRPLGNTTRRGGEGDAKNPVKVQVPDKKDDKKDDDYIGKAQGMTGRDEWLKKTRNSPAAKSGAFSDDERWSLQQKHRKWQSNNNRGAFKKAKEPPTQQGYLPGKSEWTKKSGNSPAAKSGAFTDDERWGAQQKHRTWQKTNKRGQFNPKKYKQPIIVGADESMEFNKEFNLSEEFISESVDFATNYFYKQGLNEEGLDRVIADVGVDDFTEFVLGLQEQLNEERAAERAKPRSYAKVKASVDAKDAKRKAEGKGEYSKSAASKRNYGDEVAPEGKPEKKVEVKKKVEKSVAKAKKVQPLKPISKSGLGDRIRGAVKKGVERHKEAVGKAKGELKKIGKTASDTAKQHAGHREKFVSGLKATPKERKIAGGVGKAVKKAVVGEDAKYGYDKKGRSLNPADVEERRRKDDDLFGSPNSKKKVKESYEDEPPIKDQTDKQLASVTFDGGGPDGGATITGTGDPREIPTFVTLIKQKLRARGILVSHHVPEGDVISEKQKDTPDQVKAVIAFDKARKGTDDATYDSEHGKKKQAKKERDYAKWQRDKGAEDAQKSGHPWEHAKGSTREKEGKKSEKHAHIKDDKSWGYEDLNTAKDIVRTILEKDLDAKERRALPDKDFALPGKGEGPEGKQAGSYPIPDKSHARMALAMVAKHGSAKEKAEVRAAVEKKFPGIDVSEGALTQAPGATGIGRKIAGGLENATTKVDSFLNKQGIKTPVRGNAGNIRPTPSPTNPGTSRGQLPR